MKQDQISTRCAGIDVGKRVLDAAVHGQALATQVANDAAGIAELLRWLRSAGATRVGLEASGGYERAVVKALHAEGFEVVVHQPLEVRLFARLKRLKAKNDRIDALLIAAATARVETVRAAQDPRLQDLAERFTAYEQVTDQAARMKVFLEHVTLKDLKASLVAQIRGLERLKAKLAAGLLAAIKADPELLSRYKLLISLPGVGPIVAAALIVRMPELGSMQPGQAAALLGVAPYDRDSGQHRGQRFIHGGRSRPRRFVYLAALAAKRCCPSLKAFATRLAEHGKPPKVVLVAVMRKLVEAANLVLRRQQPWTKSPAT